MNKRKVAIIVFYDLKGNILLQDRKNISKSGELYGMFGGGIEEGETPEETIKRELNEELGIDTLELINFRFFKRFKMYIEEKDMELEREVFASEIPNLNNLKINEGELALIKFEEISNLNGMVPGDLEIIQEVYNSTKNLWII